MGVLPDRQVAHLRVTYSPLLPDTTLGISTSPVSGSSLFSDGLANWKLTKLECGVQTQVIYKDISFTPIHCAADSAVNSFSIRPDLPSGLSFNEETGTLSGVYTGEPQKVTYTITATYNTTSVSQTVTLDYRSTNYARCCDF